MRITDIRLQERNPTRRNLYIDGTFVAGIGPETLLRFGLRKGDEISSEKLAEVEKTEELVNAKGAALRYLSVRPRTEKEIRDKLREKEYGDEEIAKTLEALKKAGLVNDAEFSRMYIHDQLLRRPAGAIAIARKLLFLGISKEIVETSIKENLDVTDLRDRALKTSRDFARKAHALRKEESGARLKQRTGAFLARRGFSWEMIQDVLRALAEESAFGAEGTHNDTQADE